jgi:hypothetical protein
MHGFECSFCKQELSRVLVLTPNKSDTLQDVSFSQFDTSKFVEDEESKILFESIADLTYFKRVNSIYCRLCSPAESDKKLVKFCSKESLRDHLREKHGTYFCMLCADKHQLFCHEWKLFSSLYELKDHIRNGTPGTSDQIGIEPHPTCRLCRQVVFDKDALYFHLERDHFKCHLCHARGGQTYFANYDALLNHFDDKHFLCPDPQCLSNKFVVFDNELDFRAHTLRVHASSKLPARERKKLAQIDLRSLAVGSEQNPDSKEEPFEPPSETMFIPSEASFGDEKEFPQLSSGIPGMSISSATTWGTRLKSSSRIDDVEQFPALASGPRPTVSTKWRTGPSRRVPISSRAPSKPSSESFPPLVSVRSPNVGAARSENAIRAARKPPPIKDPEVFPALSRSSSSESADSRPRTIESKVDPFDSRIRKVFGSLERLPFPDTVPDHERLSKNQDLISFLESQWNSPEKSSEFRRISSSYLKSKILADEYVHRFVSLFDPTTIDRAKAELIFNLLMKVVSLLPDEGKRISIHVAYSALVGRKSASDESKTLLLTIGYCKSTLSRPVNLDFESDSCVRNFEFLKDLSVASCDVLLERIAKNSKFKISKSDQDVVQRVASGVREAHLKKPFFLDNIGMSSQFSGHVRNLLESGETFEVMGVWCDEVLSSTSSKDLFLFCTFMQKLSERFQS